jgi:hypothetical protein
MIWILCFHRWQRTFHFFFFIEIENFRGEGKILMRHTHDTTFSEKILDFYKILEESEQFFFFERKWKIWGDFSAFLKCEAAKFCLAWCDSMSNMITFFYCKTDNLSCLNEKNCLVNVKAKEFLMCFYVICMNKHVGMTLSVFLYVLYTGARGTDHPLFLTFCLQTYFQ